MLAAATIHSGVILFRPPQRIIARAEELIAAPVLAPWRALQFADWLDELADMAVSAGWSELQVAETRALASRVRSRAPCRQISAPVCIMNNPAQECAIEGIPS